MDEVPLVNTAACFGVLDSAISVSSYNPETLLSFDSQLAALPQYVLKQFRVVSIIKPDLKLMLQAHLISQGMQTMWYGFVLLKQFFCSIHNFISD